MQSYNYKRFNPRDYNFTMPEELSLGEKMPDFQFFDLDGNVVSLSSFLGKKVVLETGSITCPMYVKTIRDMNQLASKYPDVDFIVVYVREAHPGEKLSSHQSLDEKIQCAHQLKEIEPERRRVLIDSLEGGFHQSVGALPQMLFILDEEGCLLFRSTWNDPELVECILSGRLPANEVERAEREPTKPGPLTLIKAAGRGGWLGIFDLIISIPRLLWMHRKAGAQPFKGC